MSYGRQIKGYKYILVCIDIFSKYVLTYPTKTRKVEGDLLGIEFFFETMGKPDFLQADNEFKNEGVQSLCDRHDIKLIHSTPYNPQANGQVERTNRTIKSILNLYFEEAGNNKWIDVIAPITVNINNTKLRTLLNHTPLQVHGSGNQRLIERIVHHQFNMKVDWVEKWNIDHTLPEIHRGDYCCCWR